MASALQFLFQAISNAGDEQDLKKRVVMQMGEYFAAKRAGIFFFADIPLSDSWANNLFDIALSVEHNPVVRYLVERHAPVHEELLLKPGCWNNICPRTDHAHVMAGPIVSKGRLDGVIGFTRESGKPAFDNQNIADLGAICLHLSTWFALHNVIKKERKATKKLASVNSYRLTPRELEIVNLVAKGLTNSQIGVELWITENSVKQALKRIFRKLDVSSRAEMVAQFLLVK